MSVDVALCQYGLAGVDSVEQLTGRAAELFDRAGPADVYVLPELFAVDAAAATAGEPPVLSAAAFAQLRTWCAEQAAARDAVVVGGSAYVEDGDAVRNRCPVASPDGEVVTHDKVRPIPEERADGVTAGERAPAVVECGDLSVGVLVCYDVEFPGVARSAVDRGAELLVVPSWTAGEAGFQRVRRCAAARAVEDQAFVAQVSLVGTHPDDAVGGATGRSALFAPCDDVVGPHGTRLSLPRDEHAAATATVDPDRLRTARESASVRPYTDTRHFEQ